MIFTFLILTFYRGIRILSRLLRQMKNLIVPITVVYPVASSRNLIVPITVANPVSGSRNLIVTITVVYPVSGSRNLIVPITVVYPVAGSRNLKTRREARLCKTVN